MFLGESFIPAGFTIIISLASLHRNPETFQNPTRFDPEHFSPKNEKAKEKNAFLPFSGGPRNCIGEDDINLQLIFKVAFIVKI